MANVRHNAKELNKNQVCIIGCWYSQISLIVVAAFSIVCILVLSCRLYYQNLYLYCRQLLIRDIT